MRPWHAPAPWPKGNTMDLPEQERPDDDCILCGRCMEVCPVLGCTGREELGPRAKGLMARRLKESPGELSLDKVKALASLCAGCDRCRSVCPQSVDIPARMSAIKQGSRDWTDWMVRALFSTAAVSMPILLRLAALGLGGAPPAIQGLRPWLRLIPPTPPFATRSVLLFPGCVAKFGAPGWTKSATQLLRAMGVHVELPEFSCCDFTLGRSGFIRDASRAMQRNVGLWREAGRPEVATFCATCLTGLKAYAGHPGWDPMERETWVRSVRPLDAFLKGARVEPDGDVPPSTVAVHRPCHALPGASWIEQAAAGVREIVTSTDCCGFGGTLQLLNRPLSRRIAGQLWGNVGAKESASSGAQVLSGCSGCVLQLGATRPRGAETGHWLEIINPA
jgi:glycolate oxidase iron-sulfur subunit